MRTRSSSSLALLGIYVVMFVAVSVALFTSCASTYEHSRARYVNGAEVERETIKGKGDASPQWPGYGPQAQPQPQEAPAPTIVVPQGTTNVEVRYHHGYPYRSKVRRNR